jgi:hypothetical protein
MRFLRRLGCVCVALLCVPAAAAQAAPVTLLGADGRARVVQDPFVPAAASPVPARAADARPPRARPAAPAGPTVRGELRRLLAAGAIDAPTHDADRALYDRAAGLRRTLTGARKVELGAVVTTLEAIARAGALTPSRLPALFATLERNVRWWTTGPLLAPGRRVAFAGSELVWQYYPGQGLQLQVLASFGKLNALWQGRTYDARLAHLLDELLALPAERAGGLAWEYYFTFDGGAPPWVSGLAQGTAVQALARAAIRLDRKETVLPVAQRALGIFEAPPPDGVRVPDGDGAHYLIYSFAPGLRVLNGFAQALIGLHDFAGYANDPRARGLFEAGERAARRETPTYDTGAWSLYSRGTVERESDLGYHRLLRDFLGGLCARTGQPAYCVTRDHLTFYLTQKPVVAIATTRVRGGRTQRLRFSLSKISRVGITVSRRGRVVLSRPAFVAARGRRFVEWAVPRRAGAYAVAVTAVDLAGNVGSAAGPVEVLAPKRRARAPGRP